MQLFVGSQFSTPSTPLAHVSKATSPSLPSSKVAAQSTASDSPKSSTEGAPITPPSSSSKGILTSPIIHTPSLEAAEELEVPRSMFPLKRGYRYILPSDDMEDMPCKKFKPLLTSAFEKSKPEVADLRSMRLLQLARASRATFAARTRYQRLRLKELDIIRSLAVDELEESAALTKEVECQLGEVKHAVESEGYGLIDRKSCLFPKKEADDVEDEDNNSDSTDWSAHGFHHARKAGSPTPSPDSSLIF